VAGRAASAGWARTRCLLDPNGVEDALQPGTAIFVRYHNEDTGAPGQVAHIIVRHPSAEGWAEVYSDAE